MRGKMSESRPITTPPRRRNNLLAHVQHVFNSGNVGIGPGVTNASGGGGGGGISSSAIEASSSPSNGGCASTNGTIRKLESYHHALLESGCQSAKSSPMPHRRLDKLEGVIRDKPITPAISSMRRTFDCGSVGADDNNSATSSCESSPAFLRKRLNSNGTAAGCMTSNVMDHRFINNHQESPMPYRRHQHPTTTVADYKNAINKSSFRFDKGECKSMTQRQSSSSSSPPPPLPMRTCYDTECCSTSHRPVFDQTSGGGHRPVFIAHHDDVTHQVANLSSPAKSRLGEPGIFASPARSVCSNRVNNFINDDDINDDHVTMQPHADQSIVSGWLKFRDNKRVSAVTFKSHNFAQSFCFQFRTIHFSFVSLYATGRCCCRK